MVIDFRVNLFFAELPGFTAECLRTASDEEFRSFQNELAAMPDSGDIIQGTGGLRKTRFKLAGRGKSGSARVIYLWLPHARCIVLFHFYTKQTKADLSAGDKKALREAVQIIKECYQP
ncbi:MAG: type II toxin-antitoxin system RelE/ParE family toxin [Verrucomicrobiaceae bacterium]|jgi:mRNA-degrading endonuclease RelE of RelBE toxin-antitoxin system|nr:type II toxin-antitoxin system RelE/ParE family toxin [Verrucomicrobiaceae bacterium]